MINAKKKSLSSVELLGDGTPLRQFMYAGDAAEVMIECIHKELEGEYNVAPNENLSVFEIATAVKETVGYEGAISFNGKMNGIFRKDICSEKLLAVVNHKFTLLKKGLKITYQKLLEFECGN
jgi:GDP-L-fucose synthase